MCVPLKGKLEASILYRGTSLEDFDVSMHVYIGLCACVSVRVCARAPLKGKLEASILYRGTSLEDFNVSMHVYIGLCVCVCLCVCVRARH
jgi:hypothetical protein